jgi:hypothetical protein
MSFLDVPNTQEGLLREIKDLVQTDGMLLQVYMLADLKETATQDLRRILQFLRLQMMTEEDARQHLRAISTESVGESAKVSLFKIISEQALH